MRVRRYLVEKLSKAEVDDLTKRWFELNDIPTGTGNYIKSDGTKAAKISNTDKRKAFDEIYDEATDKTFGKLNIKSYDDVKKYMRKAWLKMGFEAGDGNDPTMNTVLKVLEDAHDRAKDDAAGNILKFIVENYQRIRKIITDKDDYISTKMRSFLISRDDIWTYPADSIVQILNVLYSSIKDATSDEERNNIVNKFINANNLRDLLSDEDLSNDEDSGVIKVQKLDINKKPQDIIDILNQSNFDFKNKSDLDMLQDIVTKATEQL